MSEKAYSISGTQQGIYIECVNNPSSTLYNLPFLYKLPAELDVEKFINAFEKAIEYNKGFSTRLFISESGEIMQKISEEKATVERVNMTENEFAEIKKSLIVPYDLVGGKLWRATLYKTECSNWFFFDAHHIIMDGTSYGVFTKQIRMLYDGQELTEFSANGIDVAEMEDEIKKQPIYKTAEEYFLNLLDDVDCDSAPFPDVCGKAPCQEQIFVDLKIDDDLLTSFLKKYSVSKTVYFTAVMGFLTAKYGYKNNAAISTVYNGRNRAEFKNAVTMLVKTLPFVTDFEKTPTMDLFMRSANEQIVKGREYSFYPFTDMAAKTDINSDILFAYQGDIHNVSIIQGIDTEGVQLFDETSVEQSKLIVEVWKNPGEACKLFINYRADTYSKEFVQSFGRAFETAANEFLVQEKLDEISIISQDDIDKITVFNNATKADVDLTKTVVEMFREQAAENPDNIAVVYENNKYTYKQVDDISERIAQNLVLRGLKAEDVVAVLIPRCEYIAIAPLGIIKAGAAYQPLDPTYPKDRLQFMVQDSGAKLLIAERQLVGLLEGYTGDVIYLDELANMEYKNVTLPVAKPEDLFILLYTSGSTGLPKGCMLEYGNITAFSNWFGKYYSIDSTSKCAAYASFGFDASMMDTYGAICFGAELHVIPESIRLDFTAIGDYFEENGITHAFMTTQIGRQFAMSMSPSKLKHLSTGGEKLVPCEPPKGYKFYNLYGPTECTVLTTAFLVDRYYNNVPIGRPCDNFKLYVTDKKGKMMPIGACGELMISGYQVSRGYLNRPEKTAEVYTVNPFDNEKGYEKMYHSGDVVRYMPDGNIQIIGRQDSQVKVRGFRIELTEVEEIIRRFDGIKDATVAAFDDPAGGKFITAYIVADEIIDIEKLNEFILSEKPPYIVPAVTMQIDAIPMNQNQKVNKRALPKPERKFEEIIAPQNDVQQQIYDILAEVIGHKEFGVTTSIYMAGLTSITAVRLNVLLSKAFDRPIKTSDLKENDTIEKLEKFLINTEKEERFAVQSRYPLTKTQEGIFVECIAHPGTTIYNVPILLEISNQIDSDKLKKAISAAVNAHQYVLTTLIADDAGDICFTRDNNMRFDASEIEYAVFNSTEEMTKSLLKPFELMESRLFRILMADCDGKKYLYLDFHHIISDGTSLLILLDDISKAYAGEAIEAEEYSGYDASLSEKKRRATEEYTKAKAYYDGLFDGCDAECLPYGDKKESTPKGMALNKYASIVNADLAKRFCAENKITANGFFTAAFGITLGKFANKDQAIFTTIYNGRSDSRFERSMSMYVKTYPVLCDVSVECGNKKNTQYAKEIATQLENSMANDLYSFAEISRSYRINADVMFAYQGEDFGFNELCGLPCTMIDIKLDEIKAPLNLNVFIEGNKIRFFCEYRADRFSEEYVDTFLKAYEMAIYSMIDRDTISQVSILSEDEKQLLCEWNDTDGTSYSSYVSLPERLDLSIAKNPEKLAVTAGGKSITYSELGHRANSVANGLYSLGVKAEQVVALMLHRTVDVYPTRQGILKSGGAFLSIEPDYPNDRISYIIENADVKILITTKEVYEARKSLLDTLDINVVYVDDLYKYDGSKAPDIVIQPEQLAYCIYTSGSTGKPKGVMIEHRNLCSFLDHHDKNKITHYYIDGTNTMLALAAITFDVSVLEEFIPLYHGMSVAMATEEEIHNPILLAEMMQKTGVDVMKCTPSYIQSILDVPIVRDAFSKLKAICIGAEPFPQGLYTKMREAGISGKIYNSYGPSETTVTVTIDDMTAEEISIGKPIGNTKIWILDNFGNILPRLVPGEITVAGASVGRGYIGLAEATNEKYIKVEGLNAYRSGDIGFWNGKGKIECKGRKDNQVKLRGLRIELDEIEKVMNLYEGINRSVVLVKENESGQYLCGYYTGEKELASDKIIAFMKTKLTEYMVPGVFVFLDKFPMTNNGKVDKRSLPEPTVKTEARNGKKPANDLEREFCDMFAKALGISEVFADDDFFALGGTSLSASKIAMSCMMKKIPVAYADVFENTTPQKLARFVGASDSSDEKSDGDDNHDIDTGVLSHNKSEYANEVTYEPLKRVLLSGSTGFLGVHVLRELIMQGCEKIYCLARRGSMDSPERRLKTLLMYYFDSIYDEEFKNGRIEVVEADISDDILEESLKDCDFETVINCAAIVKHFAVGDLIERVNVEGVKNLIEICKKHNAKMIQISTVSVAGESINDSVPKDKVITESDLYFGQGLENRYVNTKFRAEEAVLQAIENGLRGKVIRVGNLMSREEDGEFQINYITNGFMSRLRAYATLHKFPVGGSDAEVEFSPIDYVAKAVTLLAGTNDSFTVFHAYNCHHVHMANVIDVMNELGLNIEVVGDKEYAEHFNDLLQDEKLNMKISSLISYDSSDGGEHRFIGSSNKFTIKVLYRLGFSWPLVNKNYMKRAIEALSTLDFFDEED